MTERSSRFLDRVSVEREVLNTINQSPLFIDVPIHGITAAAIQNWTARAVSVLDQHRLTKIESELVEIALVTGLIADNSRATFEERPITARADIEKSLGAIRESLK